jgi:hypothetical protein
LLLYACMMQIGVHLKKNDCMGSMGEANSSK